MYALCIYFLPTSHDILLDIVIFNEYKEYILPEYQQLEYYDIIKEINRSNISSFLCKSISIMFTVVFWEYMVVLTLPAFLGQHLSLCLQFLIAWCKTEFKFNQIYIHKLKHDSQNFNTYMHVSFLIFYSFICIWIICLFMFKIYSINV